MRDRTKATPGHTSEVTPQAEANIKALKGGGHPLPESTRAFFEPRFGTDFSRVRVHSGADAGQSAQEVNAHAYTVGHDIVFAAGRFAPQTHEGRRLIAHELTHVVQQASRPYLTCRKRTHLRLRRVRRIRTRQKARKYSNR